MRYILISLTIFLTGCINQNGISLEYNDDCHIEYGLYGDYQTKCNYNFYNRKQERKDCLQCN